MNGHKCTLLRVNIRGPGDDVLGMPELLRLGAELHAKNRDEASLARR